MAGLDDLIRYFDVSVSDNRFAFSPQHKTQGDRLFLGRVLFALTRCLTNHIPTWVH